MKKQYKLIKEYPGSFKLGSIVIKQAYGSYYHFKDDKNDRTYPISEEYIEFYPEFWEEITINDDYEILKYISKNKKCIIPSYGELYNHGDWDIYSVKRLSDGEIFTVGDVTYLTNENGHRCPITSIDLVKNVSKARLEKYRNGECIKIKLASLTKNIWGSFYLENIRPVEKKLFTTYDGVNIYKGDKFYTIGGSRGIWQYGNKIVEGVAEIGTGQLHKSKCIHGDKTYWINFSSKEKAEEWIIMNKPCISLQDIDNIPELDRIIDKLKEIVKERL